MSQSEDTASRKERAPASGAGLLEGRLGRALSKALDRVGLDLRVEPGAQSEPPAAPDAADKEAARPAEGAGEGAPAGPTGAPAVADPPPGPRLAGVDELVALATWVLGRRFLASTAASGEEAPGDAPGTPLYVSSPGPERGADPRAQAPAAAERHRHRPLQAARPGAEPDRGGPDKPTPPRRRGFTFRY